jgi:hypothetical protein
LSLIEGKEKLIQEIIRITRDYKGIEQLNGGFEILEYKCESIQNFGEKRLSREFRTD